MKKLMCGFLMSVMGSLILLGPTGMSLAGNLENLERERAIMLESFLVLEPHAKKGMDHKLITRQRLIDLERLVLRDNKLLKKNRSAVRVALSNYDLTFLMHASVEKNKDVFEHWLQEVGISSTSLKKARVGRR
ncbi:MAG: hypothetical protein CMM44_03350 [Rhodospirillaceae bacterium]|nr:hypothetical protein [Rhodospirillaceae bacterium]|tara:strand:+ start:10587 stop:10985 length:399 start_codon:yes stop_codon:yes gene_type:complete